MISRLYRAAVTGYILLEAYGFVQTTTGVWSAPPTQWMSMSKEVTNSSTKEAVTSHQP